MTHDERLAEWLQQYGDLIVRTCCLYLGDRALAEDAAQETFLRAWQALGQHREPISPRNWLLRIAINTCRNIRRTAWFRRIDRSITPEELPLPACEEDRTLLLTVQNLPDKYRQLVILRYFHGLNLDEVAQTLGISRSTAYYRQQKALTALRIAWEGGDEHDRA